MSTYLVNDLRTKGSSDTDSFLSWVHRFIYKLTFGVSRSTLKTINNNDISIYTSNNDVDLHTHIHTTYKYTYTYMCILLYTVNNSLIIHGKHHWSRNVIIRVGVSLDVLTVIIGVKFFFFSSGSLQCIGGSSHPWDTKLKDFLRTFIDESNFV